MRRIDSLSELVPEDHGLAHSAIYGEPGQGVSDFPGAHHRVEDGLELAGLDGAGHVGQRLNKSGGGGGGGGREKAPPEWVEEPTKGSPMVRGELGWEG